MSAPDVELDGDVTECGGVVRGEVHADRPVVVQLVVSATDTEHAVVSRVSVDPTSGPGDFDLVVPDRGPISYEGHLFSVSWAVSAGPEGATPAPTSTPITVLPKGGLALWARQTAPPPDAAG